MDRLDRLSLRGGGWSGPVALLRKRTPATNDCMAAAGRCDRRIAAGRLLWTPHRLVARRDGQRFAGRLVAFDPQRGRGVCLPALGNRLGFTTRARRRKPAPSNGDAIGAGPSDWVSYRAVALQSWSWRADVGCRGLGDSCDLGHLPRVASRQTGQPLSIGLRVCDGRRTHRRELGHSELLAGTRGATFVFDRRVHGTPRRDGSEALALSRRRSTRRLRGGRSRDLFGLETTRRATRDPREWNSVGD